MGSSLKYCDPMRHLVCEVPDQETSSKSTDRSHPNSEDVRQASARNQCYSTDSGTENCDGMSIGDGTKRASSLRITETLPAQADYAQTIAYVPYTYLDPYYGGVMATYAPHNMVPPQVVTVAPNRVPLPTDLREEPIYVNAKQYRGILRRRQRRAKLEAQNKVVKGRKPYLHESRHLHAMRRVRGSGGRFLNTKKQEEQQQQRTAAIDGTHPSGSPSFEHGGGCLSEPEIVQSDNPKMGSTGSTYSDITSISDGDLYQLPDVISFPQDYLSHGGGRVSSGGTVILNRSQQQISIIR